MALTLEEIQGRLSARFGDAVSALMPAKDPFVVVQGEKLKEIATFLRDEPELKFDFLQDETAVDYPKEQKIRVVYHLWSYALSHAFKFKVELDRAAPKVASIVSVWPAANWLEREVFDLFGVQFEGHPDLRRIMMPDDWVGHPLRKDYQESGGYHGISNVRDNPLDLYLALDSQMRSEVAARNPLPVIPNSDAAIPSPAHPERSGASGTSAAESRGPAPVSSSSSAAPTDAGGSPALPAEDKTDG